MYFHNTQQLIIELISFYKTLKFPFILNIIQYNTIGTILLTIPSYTEVINKKLIIFYL